MTDLLINLYAFKKKMLIDLCKLLTVGAVYGTVGAVAVTLGFAALCLPLYLIYGL